MRPWSRNVRYPFPSWYVYGVKRLRSDQTNFRMPVRKGDDDCSSPGTKDLSKNACSTNTWTIRCGSKMLATYRDCATETFYFLSCPSVRVCMGVDVQGGVGV